MLYKKKSVVAFKPWCTLNFLCIIATYKMLWMSQNVTFIYNHTIVHVCDLNLWRSEVLKKIAYIEKYA